MFELLQKLITGFALLPNYLKFLTVVLVIFPTIVAALLRLTIYKHITDKVKTVKKLLDGNKSVSKPNIIQTLEIRFQRSRQQLEQVNTSALIDGIYSQEKVKFYGFSLRLEQWDYFCRFLPNLLLAFGLLGTFLGITLNLSNLSKTITELQKNGNSDLNSVFGQLQEPLQGMGIAFITSLAAVICSSLLTVINLQWNTNILKNQLISYLEDYLDNVFQPTIPGHTRIDTAVDRLVSEFSSFLHRFGDTVRDAVESSLGANIQQIVDVNRQANELAIQVYSGFQASSGTIARGADDFQHSVTAFENAIAAMMTTAARFEQVSVSFEKSKFPEKLLEATANLSDIEETFSRSAVTLAEAVKYIELAVWQLQLSTQELVNLRSEISEIKETLKKVLDFHQNHEHSLDDIVAELQELSQNFQSAVITLEKLQKQTEEVDINKYQFQTIADTLDQYISYFIEIKDELTKLVHRLQPEIKDSSNIKKPTNSDDLDDIDPDIRALRDMLGKD